MSIVASGSFTVGMVPNSFPRDSIAINQFDEHIILGHVIRPLIEIDKDGRVVPALAKEWKFSDSKLDLILKLNKRKFSNGKEITSKDVKYSLDRHILNKSQSSLFLSDIDSIEIQSETELRIKLKKPNSSLVKALSRDQLGIVPYSWRFDEKSNEPFIGDGPYRLVKKNSDWFLLANPMYEGVPPSIKEAKLFYPEKNEGKVPDLILSATRAVAGKLKILNSPNLHSRFSFAQTSFWVYPKSSLYENKKLRAKIQSLLEVIISDYASASKLKLANGIIPIGVPGHLTSRHKPPKFTTGKPVSVKLTYLTPMFDEFSNFVKTHPLISNGMVKLTMDPITPLDLGSLSDRNPDIVTGSWAGGFYDPMGFLPLPAMIVGMPFEKYIGKENRILELAKSEEDLNRKTSLFRGIDEVIQKDGFLIPGWIQDVYSVYDSKKIREVENINYAPQLSNFIADE